MSVEPQRDDDPTDLTKTQTLVFRAKQGEEEALGELYSRHAGRVRHSLAARLGGYDAADLEDIVQETFLYAFDVIRRGAFDETASEGGFRHWLAKVAVNKARDQFRQRHTKRRGEGKERLMRDVLSSSSIELDLKSPLARPSEVLRGKELEHKITEALNSLNDRQREVIDLRDHCEMSFAEIAEEMTASPATLRSLYKRAKEELRGHLERLGVRPQ